MAGKRDYYEVLSVDRGASNTEIKAAYRKLAVRHHPDRNRDDPKAEEVFKEAAEAYAVLSDADKRARFDRFGHAGVAGSGRGGFDPSVFGDFSDILGDFFGSGFGDIFGRGRRRGVSRGADLRYDLRLTFEEAVFGVEKTLRIPRLEACEDCSGTGAAGGSQPAPCGACRGHGQVRFSQGLFTVARTCPQCGGAGRVITDPCATCGGEGRSERERQLSVTIPAGVDHGSRLRLVAEGEHGRGGGPRGDLYMVLAVEPHEHFERGGAEIYDTLRLSFPQAVLGSRVEIETLHGSEELDIPAGTSHGKEFRLRGKGIERLDGHGRGDHVAQVEIAVPNPRKLSEEEIDLLKKLAEIQGHEVKEGSRVIDKVKNLFA